MPTSRPTILAFVLAAAVTTPALMAQAPGSKDVRFALTVDSIMRGPDLVGHAPEGLRWSADSQKLYFEWRKPGEAEATTYGVGRDGGTPVRLTDEQKKTAPPVSGRWDTAHRRVIFVEKGDIVLLDATGVRRQITRTTGNESNPRWARRDSAITYVRDGNLFIVPAEGAGPAIVEQLTDVAAKKPDPRLTDSQKFIRDEEEKLLEAVREQKEKKKKAEDKEQQDRLPPFELQDRQSATDLMLSPDDTHVFILVRRRPAQRQDPAEHELR